MWIYRNKNENKYRNIHNFRVKTLIKKKNVFTNSVGLSVAKKSITNCTLPWWNNNNNNRYIIIIVIAMSPWWTLKRNAYVWTQTRQTRTDINQTASERDEQFARLVFLVTIPAVFSSHDEFLFLYFYFFIHSSTLITFRHRNFPIFFPPINI